MKKIFVVVAIALAISFATPVVAADKMASLGLSFSMPYIIDPGSARGSFGLDLIGEYYINPNWALHLMFQFYFENKGFAKPLFLNPGVRYYFWADNMWTPYAAAQAIVGLKDGSFTSNFNYGFRIAPGVNFDFSELTGLNGLNMFFEVAFWGVFKGTTVWSIDVFRLGFAYAF